MKYEPRTDKDQAVQSNESESQLQAQLDALPLRPDVEGVAKTTRPENTRTIPAREKRTAASSPGSEYWLP